MDKASNNTHEEQHLAEQEQSGKVAEEHDVDIENISDDSEDEQLPDELDDGPIPFNRLHSFQAEFDPEELEVHTSFIQEDHPNAHLNHNPDIVIIGAGPVGLWVAVQIKLLLPNKNILILEKHQVYQRSHLLRLVKSSLDTIPDHPCLASFKEFAKTLIGKIRTNDLERNLWQKAEALGIKKEFMEVKDVLGLKKMFSNLKVIIGCDGSHSLVRKQVFEDKLSVKQTIEHVAFVKYDVQGQGKGLKLMDGYAGMKLMHHLIYESVGKETNGQSPVTLQIKIDADTYKKMEGAKFKTPYSLMDDKQKIDNKLMESITVWLNMRTKFNNEERVTESTKVTTVNLDVYRAKTVAKEIDNEEVAVFLCGDSACGVPFFRALNNGMICGSVLAGLFKDHEGKMNKIVKNYNSSFDKLANKEIRRAKTVTWAHSLAEKAVRINAAVPWQFISLRQIKKELLSPLAKEAKEA